MPLTAALRRRRDGGEPRWLSGAPPPRWVRALPVVLLVALALVQLATAQRLELGFLLAAIPPLATLAYGPLATFLFSVVVVILLHMPGFDLGRPGNGDLITVTFVGLLSVVIAWIRRRREAQLTTIRTVAEAAQFAVLPPLPSRVGAVRCAGLYRAAQRGTLVGGDLFDVRRGPFGVRALVGDVQGHGIAAVGTVAALLGAFREGVLDEPDLTGVADRLDRRLVVDAAAATADAAVAAGPPDASYPAQAEAEVAADAGICADATGGELFATALLLEFPAGNREVRILSCGHPQPVLLRASGAREVDVPAGTPLGLGIPGLAPRGELVLPLEPGDRLLAMTDGVTEARDATGAFYPLVERLAELEEEDPAAMTDAIWCDLVDFAREIADDVALLVFAPDPATPEGPSRA